MISRRSFIKTGSAAAAAGVLAPGIATAQSATESPIIPTPLPRQVVWQDCEVGAIFHFDMPLFAGKPWNGRDAIRKTTDPSKYNPETSPTWSSTTAPSAASTAGSATRRATRGIHAGLPCLDPKAVTT